MIRTNADKLIKISVIGEIVSPNFRQLYKISATGNPFVLPGVGGISYNLRVGDPAVGWEADHAEPGVSLENKENDFSTGRGPNTAFNALSCIGNQAVVVSGEAKGDKGIVTGKHGGVEHVLADFSSEVMEKLLIGDKIQIRACGTGLKLLDYPDIKVFNMDPSLLEAWNPQPNGEKLHVSVTHIIPAAIMGSGLGNNSVNTGDYDIQLFDQPIMNQYSLGNLRLGDIVAIIDADHSFGRIYRSGAISIGVVVHTNCLAAGHGPGVTTLMSSAEGRIVPQLNQKANVASLLKLRADI
ncbi:MAG TPA: DUF4438 domain-containing protein [Candidatus Acidoferrales bacterium]|nr:DUF4438 domain-containing protein [Candidatus Acidoferrales bacterium]